MELRRMDTTKCSVTLMLTLQEARLIGRKSTSGYLTFVGGNLVTWRSKKENVVALSSAESEYRTMHQGVTELIWLKIELYELGFGPEEPMVLFCDNKAAIEIASGTT